jgi:small subunit ribosomal protein S6
LNTYEMTFIVRPDLDEEGTRGAVAAVRRRVETTGGEIVAGYPWGPGRRRMAFPIRDFGDGYYYTIDFQLDPARVRELENALRLNDTLLRFLTVLATPLMVTQAKQRELQWANQVAQAQQPQPAPAAQSVPGQPYPSGQHAPPPPAQAGQQAPPQPSPTAQPIPAQPETQPAVVAPLSEPTVVPTEGAASSPQPSAPDEDLVTTSPPASATHEQE